VYGPVTLQREDRIIAAPHHHNTPSRVPPKITKQSHADRDARSQLNSAKRTHQALDPNSPAIRNPQLPKNPSAARELAVCQFELESPRRKAACVVSRIEARATQTP
jgi:hypothetical protein